MQTPSIHRDSAVPQGGGVARGPAGVSLRILVAEDDPVNQSVARFVLQKLGHQVEFAVTGLEAVDAVERQRFDVVFMDVHMPELDGLEATRRIRRTLAPERQPRIIALTGSGLDDDCRRCLDAGMDDFLSKPISRDRLVGALASLVAADPPAKTGISTDDLSIEIDEMVKSMGRSGTAELLATHLGWARAQFESVTIADVETLGYAAHALRSSSRVLGFHALADRCEELDVAVHEHRSVDVESALAELHGLLEAAFQVLDAEILRLRNPE